MKTDRSEIDAAVERLKALHLKVREPVEVSIAKSGKVRKNGPCPCGSDQKFKKCCLDLVRLKKLPALKHKV